MAAQDGVHLQRAGIPDEDGALLGDTRERRAVGRPHEVDQPVVEGRSDRCASAAGRQIDLLDSAVDMADE